MWHEPTACRGLGRPVVGKAMLAATSITVKNGRLELENYGQEAVRLTQITEEQKKKK